MQALGPLLGSRSLYAVSRLGLGLNEAHHGVLKRWPSGGSGRAARHPCELPGHYERCRDAVASLVRDGEERSGRPAALTLPSGTQLVGLDNFFFTVLVLWGGDAARAPRAPAVGELLLDSAGAALPAPTLEEIEAQAARVCRLSVEEVTREVGGARRDKRLKAEKLPKVCTCAALFAVLSRLYGVGSGQRVAVASEINGFDGSWALGAMVNEIAEEQTEGSRPEVAHSVAEDRGPKGARAHERVVGLVATPWAGLGVLVVTLVVLTRPWVRRAMRGPHGQFSLVSRGER